MRPSLRTSGFTAVELLIAVAIVGVLAAIAIPAYGKIVAKARQAEARINLTSIAGLESIYRKEYNSYGTLAQLGFVPDGANRYSYCAGSPSDAGACIQSSVDTFDFASAGGDIHQNPNSGGSGSGPGGASSGGSSGPGGASSGSGSSGPGGLSSGGSSDPGGGVGPGGPGPGTGSNSSGGNKDKGGGAEAPVAGGGAGGGGMPVTCASCGGLQAGASNNNGGAAAMGGVDPSSMHQSGGNIGPSGPIGPDPTGTGAHGLSLGGGASVAIGGGMLGGVGGQVGFQNAGHAVGHMAAGDPVTLSIGGNPHVTADDFEADAYGRISNRDNPFDVDRWLVDQSGPDSLVNYNPGY